MGRGTEGMWWCSAANPRRYRFAFWQIRAYVFEPGCTTSWRRKIKSAYRHSDSHGRFDCKNVNELYSLYHMLNFSRMLAAFADSIVSFDSANIIHAEPTYSHLPISNTNRPNPFQNGRKETLKATADLEIFSFNLLLLPLHRIDGRRGSLQPLSFSWSRDLTSRDLSRRSEFLNLQIIESEMHEQEECPQAVNDPL